MRTVAEYARWRGISEQRVRELLRAGELPGRRIGERQWMVDDAAYTVRAALSRPMSTSSAWALIGLLSGDDSRAAALSSRQRSRVHEYRRRLLASDEPSSLLASWLRHRGDRSVYRIDPADFGELRTDERVMLSGVSDPRAGLSDGNTIELWLRNVRTLDDLVADYLLIPDPTGQVVVHCGDEHRETTPPLGLVIADLADWNGPRENSRVAELLAALAA